MHGVFFPSIFSSYSYLFVYLKAELEKAYEVSALFGKNKRNFRARKATAAAAAFSTTSKISTNTKTPAYFRLHSLPAPAESRICSSLCSILFKKNDRPNLLTHHVRRSSFSPFFTSFLFSFILSFFLTLSFRNFLCVSRLAPFIAIFVCKRRLSLSLSFPVLHIAAAKWNSIDIFWYFENTKNGFCDKTIFVPSQVATITTAILSIQYVLYTNVE